MGLKNTPAATLKHNSMAHNSVTFVLVELNTVFCTFTENVNDTCVKFQSNNIRNVKEIFSFKLTTEKSLSLLGFFGANDLKK